MPSSSSTASSAGHKPQGVNGSGERGDAGRGGGREHLRRGQTPTSGGLGAAKGSATAVPPRGGGSRRYEGGTFSQGAPKLSLPFSTPHLVEVPQSAPQVVQVPHSPGCGTIMAADRPGAPSRTGCAVDTGERGQWGLTEEWGNPGPASTQPASTLHPQAPPSSPSGLFPLRPLGWLAPDAPYIMPSTRRRRAPSLRRKNLFSGQRGPSPSSSSSPSGSSASPTSPASPSTCGKQRQVRWPKWEPHQPSES